MGRPKKIEGPETPKPELNEVQKFLAKWLLETNKRIEQALIKEAELMGFDLISDDYKILHTLQEGKIPGLGMFTYSIDREGVITNIITVEFNLAGYVIYTNRKTEVIKSKFKLKALRGN